MKYVEHINELLNKSLSHAGSVVLYGQNIAAGSCLGGLTRNLRTEPAGMIINTPNSENSLVGIGFGMMMHGISSIFFMKQLDFLVLGMDQLVNTWNVMRTREPAASFTIFPSVIDAGYQGKQSSFNNLPDLCALARIAGYTITNKQDAECIVESQLFKPGFRIISVSQRLFGSEVLDMGRAIHVSEDQSVFQYTDGADATIACMNFALPQGVELLGRMKQAGINASLFSVNQCLHPEWSRIVKNAGVSHRIVVLDDSKCLNSLGNELIRQCALSGAEKCVLLQRPYSDEWYSVSSEEFSPDYDRVVKDLASST